MITRVVFGSLLSFCLCSSSVLGQATQKTLFVTNQMSGTVSSFRVAPDGQLTLVGAFPAGPMPQDCAVTPDGRALIVLNSNEDVIGSEEVRLLHINSDSSLSPGGNPGLVGDAPLSLAISSNDIIVIPSVGTQSMTSYQVGGSDLAQVNSVQAGVFPAKPICTPDGRFVFTIDAVGPFDLSSFSLSDSGILSPITNINFATGAAFGGVMHPSGDTLYVSTGQVNTIRRYSVNTSNGAIAFADSTPVSGNSVVELAITPDGKWMYSAHVLSDTVRVSRVNPDRSITPLNFSYLIRSNVRDVLTDGRFVYVTDETQLGGGQIGVLVFSINQTDGSLTQVAPAYSTDGQRPQFMAMWAPPVCIGDANLDGTVTFADINAVLIGMSGGSGGDANLDGIVDFKDITAVLSNIGSCG